MIDRKKFDKFYKDNYEKVVRHIIKKVRSRDLAEDIAQDVFLEILQKYDDNYISNNKMIWTLVNFRINDYFRDIKRNRRRGCKDTVQQKLVDVLIDSAYANLVSDIMNMTKGKLREKYPDIKELLEDLCDFLEENPP